ncbi:2-dehydropantoate 2-reductase [Fontibacillus phaseoli]|uniref:2-dehydropantoate 2-reductase n=1 Tax=Fontibacillus phaseoli TaxID=1416533 RepID=A0A369BMH7_9BACL|nr:2-dehydropantoate 2-reductase [Fontibacillus phaseoli]RCX22809.1 2-dehydropantoate 2-reductase [Fontibacillus phaseoli]
MKIDIIGAGALGMLFGGMLAGAGEQVAFWTRTPEQAEMLNREGFEVEGPKESKFFIDSGSFAAHTLHQAAEHGRDRAPDWILLTVKQRHIDDRLLKAMGEIMGPKTKIACYQNGVGHLEKIKTAFPDRYLYAVVTTEGAKRTSGGNVKRAGLGKTEVGIPVSAGLKKREQGSLAELDRIGRENAESLILGLEKAGFAVFLSNDIDKEIYRKLLINAVINPLTALLRIPNGELLARNERTDLMRQLCDEGVAVYQAYGISVDPDMYGTIAAVCHSTAANTSSMLKDVLEGSPTEVDFINGRLVEMARKVNLHIPGHETLWRLISAL